VIAIKLWAVISGNIIDICLILIKLVTSRECELCGDNDHTTKFCEKQRSKEIPLQKAPQSMANIRSVVIPSNKYCKKCLSGCFNNSSAKLSTLIWDADTLSFAVSHLSAASINNLIDKEQCSLSYVRIDDAISAIKDFGRFSILNKVDISDAFKQLGIRKDQHHLYCIKWRKL
jgi:hypothetical protein